MIELLIAAAMTTSAAPVARPAFEATVVQLHNQERASVGSPPLEWDDRLAHDAAAWADHLADIDDLVHWGEENDGDNGQGENLWLGTRGGFNLAQMVGGWSEEKKPLARLASWEDDFETVGHYTQMVWAGTRKVGCAVRSNRANDVLVCRYFPAGNVTGEQPYPRPQRTVFAAR